MAWITRHSEITPSWTLAFLGSRMWLHLSQGFPSWSLHKGAHGSHLSTVRSSQSKIRRWSSSLIKEELIFIEGYAKFDYKPFYSGLSGGSIFATCGETCIGGRGGYLQTYSIHLERNVVGSIIVATEETWSYLTTYGIGEALEPSKITQWETVLVQTPLVDKKIVIALLLLYSNTITFCCRNTVVNLSMVEYWIVEYFLHFSNIICAPKLGRCILSKVYIVYWLFLLPDWYVGILGDLFAWLVCSCSLIGMLQLERYFALLKLLIAP